jgi:hypothetical protein
MPLRTPSYKTVSTNREHRLGFFDASSPGRIIDWADLISLPLSYRAHIGWLIAVDKPAGLGYFGGRYWGCAASSIGDLDVLLSVATDRRCRINDEEDFFAKDYRNIGRVVVHSVHWDTSDCSILQYFIRSLHWYPDQVLFSPNSDSATNLRLLAGIFLRDLGCGLQLVSNIPLTVYIHTHLYIYANFLQETLAVKTNLPAGE